MPDAWTVDVSIDWSPILMSIYLNNILQYDLLPETIYGLAACRAAFVNPPDSPIANCAGSLQEEDETYTHKTFPIPAGPILSAIESIQVVDAMLGIGFDEDDKTPMALRSLKVMDSSGAGISSLRCALRSNAFLAKCTQLETLVFHGHLLHQSPLVRNPRASSQKELYLAQFDSDITLLSLSTAMSLSTDMSFPNLEKCGTTVYRINALHRLLSSPSISDRSLPWVDSRTMIPLAQITKLTTSSTGLRPRYSLPPSGVPTFTGLEELVIDCRQDNVSQGLTTLIDARVVHAVANGYERPLSTVFLWTSSKPERTVSETWTSTRQENGFLSKILIP